ncbi:MASE3 domain-containing protein [Bacillus sp. 31A1R]|uniref:Oxygen sensor histidine kinase NreB n=1 Tax=Robertmurraya mangrovi TaxID=3098077 RepID=A0ABU5J3F7_9BACI|nr:MASE3 domain-containing protein [Bacillus sp. 31A1R]MDZ5473968.1 MASE3 domain-containing protein [Bacillus sp. 31A1R]
MLLESINKLNKLEKNTVILAITAVLLFLIIQGLSHSYLENTHPHFLILHTILEFFSIFVSFIIFFQGWLTFKHAPSKHRLFVSILFFQVGAFDLAHTLLYKGMPFFQDANTLSKATWFWIIARLIESIGLAFVFSRKKDSTIRNTDKNLLFLSASIITGMIITGVVSIPEKLPVLLIEGQGVTPFKVLLEYVISVFHLITMVLIIKKYVITKKEDMLVVVGGLVFLLLGELVFTLYNNVHSMMNLLGHIYKVLGYFYLMKGIFFPQFEEIFVEKERAQTKWKEAETKLIENEKKLSTLVIQAQEEERKRVSRELHDGIGQALYSILVSLKMIRKRKESEHLKEELQLIEQMTGESMEEVKRIATQLRPSALDDLGLLPAMKSFKDQFEQTHQIKINLKAEKVSKRLLPEIETAIYRIYQESLNNIAKYAKATTIEVELRVEDDNLILYVEDDGDGFDIKEVLNKEGKGIGLYSMKERAQLLSGQFFVHSEINKGTIIEVEIPIQYAEEPQN